MNITVSRANVFVKRIPLLSMLGIVPLVSIFV